MTTPADAPARDGDTTNVVIDLDSIVYPLLTAMGVDYQDVPSWSSLVSICGSVPALMERFYAAFSYEAMNEHGMFDGCLAAMQHLHDEHGVRFHLATDRPGRFHEDVRRIMDELGAPVQSIIFTSDKVAVCREVGARVLIDDKPETIIAAHTEGGIIPISLGWPYVLNEAVPEAPTLLLADDWTDGSMVAHILAAIAATAEPAEIAG